MKKLFLTCFLIVACFIVQAQKKGNAKLLINSKTVSKKDLGTKLKKLLKKCGLDTTMYQMYIIVEPPGIARGIEFELADSTTITFQIDRTSDFFHMNYRTILNKRVIGIGWATANCTTQYLGRGFLLWGITNPYCIRKRKSGQLKN